MDTKIKVSCIVVGLNEGHLLDKCLSSINFCDEIIYFDLGSTDKSVEIAATHNAKVIHHERVLASEWIQAKYYRTTRYDWILITDPDEVTDPLLAQQIIDLFNNKKISEKVGAIQVPWLFYYKQYLLKGTVWGGINSKIHVVHKDRFQFFAKVHTGRRLLPGYEKLKITYQGEGSQNVVHHHWMQGINNLLEKHRRYLSNEGPARFEKGQRVSLNNLWMEPLRSFKKSYFTLSGWKDGFLGIFLSCFWAWYQTSAQIALFRYQKNQLKHK